MSGFPTRTSRTAFGPTKLNATAGTIHPAYHVAATETNLAYWQVAGLSVGGPRAWGQVTWDGATSVALTSAGEAWDPNSSSVPTVARSGAGVYTVTYAATYTDETGTAVSTNLLAATITALSSAAARIATYTISSSRILNVYVWDAAGAAADASFTFSVY